MPIFILCAKRLVYKSNLKLILATSKNKNDDYIKNHWKRNKKKNYGNNLELQIKTKCSGMRDFMLEHALERFFGYLNKYKNYSMLEI